MGRSNCYEMIQFVAHSWPQTWGHEDRAKPRTTKRTPSVGHACFAHALRTLHVHAFVSGQPQCPDRGPRLGAVAAGSQTG